jgi:putative phage-type endonuclease
MILYLYDLEDLEDLYHTIIPIEEEISEEEKEEIIEVILELIDEVFTKEPTLLFEENINNTLYDIIEEILEVQLEYVIDEDILEELIDESIYIYFLMFHDDKLEKIIIETENNDDINVYLKEDLKTDLKEDLKTDLKEDNDKIAEILHYLRNIPQPTQRTKEWYEFRKNHITASNAWKALENEKKINSLIYEKCQPIIVNEDENSPEKQVNTKSPLHWGQKYEPLSVMIYENIYDSKVEEYGCIEHPQYKFLAASPDGIVVQSNTGRYGRMLEIKNPTSRVINGIPEHEYFVQMQFQMEVCGLDYCDFLETKFSEYNNLLEFKEDKLNDEEFNKTSKGYYKGVIIQFYQNNKPIYKYMPLHLKTFEEIEKWQEENIDKYQSEPYNYVFMNFIYWRLEIFSCILVKRDKNWFNNNIKQLEKVWNTIEEERITGYEHRAPTKRNKDNVSKQTSQPKNDEVCFLKVIKLT